MPRRIRLLCPLAFEARVLRAARIDGLPAPTVVGPRDGPARWVASQAETGDLVVIAGVAGGLRREPAVAHAAVVDEVVDEHHGRWTCPVHLPPALPRCGCVSRDATVIAADERHGLAARHPRAALVDLEASRFAAAAARRGLDWLVVRGVSDGPDARLPPGIDGWVDDEGRTRVGRVALDLMRRPIDLPTVLRLGRSGSAAMRAVAALLECLLREASDASGAVADAATAGVLLFGGSFDPPQRAHVELPRLAARRLGCTGVVYLPTSANPLKGEAPASAEDRLAMLRLALRDVPEAAIDTLELDAPPPAYTVDSLRALRRRLGPAARLVLLMGSDAALSFGRWREPEAILELAEIAVMLRPPLDRAGFADALAEASPPRGAAWWLERTLDLPTIEASATEVRRRLAAGESVDDLLDPAVAEYIRARGLYGART